MKKIAIPPMPKGGLIGGKNVQPLSIKSAETADMVRYMAESIEHIFTRGIEVAGLDVQEAAFALGLGTKIAFAKCHVENRGENSEDMMQMFFEAIANGSVQEINIEVNVIESLEEAQAISEQASIPKEQLH